MVLMIKLFQCELSEAAETMLLFFCDNVLHHFNLKEASEACIKFLGKASVWNSTAFEKIVSRIDIYEVLKSLQDYDKEKWGSILRLALSMIKSRFPGERGYASPLLPENVPFSALEQTFNVPRLQDSTIMEYLRFLRKLVSERDLNIGLLIGTSRLFEMIGFWYGDGGVAMKKACIITVHDIVMKSHRSLGLMNELWMYHGDLVVTMLSDAVFWDEPEDIVINMIWEILQVTVKTVELVCSITEESKLLLNHMRDLEIFETLRGFSVNPHFTEKMAAAIAESEYTLRRLIGTDCEMDALSKERE
jgi:hypothetical protein